ncbi:MAG: hypothetical protein KatS3mg061_1997 [Dehalococcoidia bacterium]|nr:MAG: hypothetical protein KatS3mg061_1997 [Dehalococcoidia bacterium]
MDDEIRRAVRDFLLAGQAGSYLITLQAHGRPYATQVSALVEADFSIRIRTGEDTLKARHARANPSVGVLFVERRDGPQRNVLIQGDAALTNDVAELDDFFATLHRRYGLTIDRTSPRMAKSCLIKVRPVFLRAEGFHPRQFSTVVFEHLA